MTEIPSGVYALAGALIGSLTTVLTLRIQKKNEFKKELLKLAFEMAKEDRSTQIQSILHSKKEAGVLPIESYYLYYYNILKVLTSESKDIESKVKEIKENQKGLEGGLYA